MSTLEIPAGARIPMGAPPQWLAAAAAAHWQCECTTTGPKAACGTSHRKHEASRCQHRAAGSIAVHLVLAPDATGALRLLCEPCAAGHTRTANRASKTAAVSTERDDQLSLF